jgi:hypothetical protein
LAKIALSHLRTVGRAEHEEAVEDALDETHLHFRGGCRAERGREEQKAEDDPDTR